MIIKHIIIICLLLGIIPISNSSTDIEIDNSIWVSFLFNTKLSNTIQTSIEFQPALFTNTSTIGTSLSYSNPDILPNTTFGVGNNHQINYRTSSSIFTDDTIWQSISLHKQLSSNLRTQTRLRIEERFPSNGDVSVRFRFRIKYDYTTPIKDMSFTIFDEVIFNTDNIRFTNQLNTGFNQNRIFLGISYKITPSVQYDIGYMNQFIMNQPSKYIINNVLITSISVNF